MQHRGEFAFDQAVYLPVEQMVRDGRFPNLDALMHQLVAQAAASWPRADKGAMWKIAGHMAFHRGRMALWKWIKRKLLKDAGEVYEAVRPFVVGDMRRNLARPRRGPGRPGGDQQDHPGASGRSGPRSRTWSGSPGTPQARDTSAPGSVWFQDMVNSRRGGHLP